MRPVLGELWGEPLSAYFVLLLVGFAVATWSLVRWAKRAGLPHGPIIDVGLASIVGGVLGGRLLHVLADGYFWDYVHLCTDPSSVSWAVTQARCSAISGSWDAATRVCHPVLRDCWAWAKFYQGGLVYYGGLLGGAAFAVWILRRDRMPVRTVADAAAPGVAMGLFFGRIGCFLGGCCFGRATGSALGVRFPGYSPASEGQFREHLLGHPGMLSLPVHPTQLYEALGCLAIAVGLGMWSPRRQRFSGQTSLLFLSLYAALRFGLEFLRADDRGALAGLSTSQWIGAVVVVLVVWEWRRLSRRSAVAAAGVA